MKRAELPYSDLRLATCSPDRASMPAAIRADRPGMRRPSKIPCSTGLPDLPSRPAISGSLLTFAENAFPPLPSELIMPLAGPSSRAASSASGGDAGRVGSVPAGIAKMRLLPFPIYSGTETLRWTTLLGRIGFLLETRAPSAGRLAGPCI
jgi:hypothetical protein